MVAAASNYFGKFVNENFTTSGDGSFSFKEFAPSAAYTLTAEQPLFLNDGLETAETPGVAEPGLEEFSLDIAGNDLFNLEIGEIGGANVKANFGEVGLAFLLGGAQARDHRVAAGERHPATTDQRYALAYPVAGI